ncbi:MAG: type VI secretion system baseplate subunit TssK, partial [Rhizobiaceae bacterium]|nr:type VI secretion system baseplate subunit TssK [Rhizobiaceae bacterium]
MSWYSKVAWSEGLFLRQHHLQQSDRYFEQLIESRMRHVTPYPWGFAQIEIDRDLAQQNKFGLRRASGIFTDGTPFDMPGTSPLPLPIDVPEGSDKQIVWLTMPAAAINGRELDMPQAMSGSRYLRDIETIVDSASSMHVEEEIEVAHPRVSFEVRSTPKTGFHCLKVAKILEVRDKTILFDESFAPPVLS